MRPSTARRIERLSSLVAEFAARDLGPAGVAALLKCSGSAARIYLIELIDSGVIGPSPNRQPNGGIKQMVYRLNADRRLVDEFLAALANPGNTRAAAVRREPGLGCSAGYPGTVPDGIDSACEVRAITAKRDPLVTALFGVPIREPNFAPR
jgi:hypothetical protein